MVNTKPPADGEETIGYLAADRRPQHSNQLIEQKRFHARY